MEGTHSTIVLVEKAQGPARIEWYSELKKPKVIPGIKPGPLKQKAIALLLVPPPYPTG